MSKVFVIQSSLKKHRKCFKTECTLRQKLMPDFNAILLFLKNALKQTLCEKRENAQKKSNTPKWLEL